LRVQREEISRLAERYAARHFTYAMGSASEVRELFETNGFRVDALLEGSVAEGNRQAAAGASVRRGAGYAEVVGVRTAEPQGAGRSSSDTKSSNFPLALRGMLSR